MCSQQKWKRYWLALHPASRQGVARLELSEAVHERTTVVVRRNPERKVVRLADCVSVVKLPPHAEACPRENMAAFCVETQDKKLVFAAEKESCGEWVDIICNIAFLVRVWIFSDMFLLHTTMAFKSLGSDSIKRKCFYSARMHFTKESACDPGPQNQS